ncbi:MAG: hypothetical protein CMC67_07620 [Flavobacteriaceae bacterium]|nr:hypothetical protein [Flavobacteriaceae bacterium]|tara:strand:+ start:316 stop:504 length:189 start_codon:yes stop_codon:yes gene_type:complete
MKKWNVTIKNIYGEKQTFYSSIKKREDAIIDVLSKIENKQQINNIKSVDTIPLNKYLKNELC